jgi:hypothetical protein
MHESLGTVPSREKVGCHSRRVIPGLEMQVLGRGNLEVESNPWSTCVCEGILDMSDMAWHSNCG